MDKNKLIIFAAIGAAAFYFFMNKKKAGSDDFEEEEEFIPRTPEQQAAETSQRPKTKEEQQTSSYEDYLKSKPTTLDVPKKIIVGDSKPFVATSPSTFTVDNLINLGKKKQNSMLDRRKITAVQIIASDSQNNGVTNTGTVSETLPVGSLPEFQLTFAKNQKIIAVAPFSNLHTASNGGKYYFFCSEVGKHRIGDCFISQIGNESLSGRVIILKFFYD